MSLFFTIFNDFGTILVYTVCERRNTESKAPERKSGANAREQRALPPKSMPRGSTRQRKVNVPASVTAHGVSDDLETA